VTIQRIDHVFTDDPVYSLQMKQTITIKLLDFSTWVKLCQGYANDRFTLKLLAVPKDIAPDKSDISVIAEKDSDGRGVAILYASDSGSCEGFAHIIVEDASKMGFDPIRSCKITRRLSGTSRKEAKSDDQ
jgi:hypothetical protein